MSPISAIFLYKTFNLHSVKSKKCSCILFANAPSDFFHPIYLFPLKASPPKWDPEKAAKREKGRSSPASYRPGEGETEPCQLFYDERADRERTFKEHQPRHST